MLRASEQGCNDFHDGSSRKLAIYQRPYRDSYFQRNPRNSASTSPNPIEFYSIQQIGGLSGRTAPEILSPSGTVAPSSGDRYRLSRGRRIRRYDGCTATRERERERERENLHRARRGSSRRATNRSSTVVALHGR